MAFDFYPEDRIWRDDRPTGRARLWSWGLVLGAVALVVSVDGDVRAPLERGDVQVSSQQVLESDGWLESIRKESYWQGRRKSQGAPSSIDRSERSSLGAVAVPAPWPFGQAPVARDGAGAGRENGQGGVRTYKTVCVRLCDGYYYPVSFATTEDRFAQDAKSCAASCLAPTKLYVQASDAMPEEMHDVAGEPYLALPTAFAYRQSYNKACTCRPHPWEAAARAQHQVYALERQRQRETSRSKRGRARAEIDGLKSEIEARHAAQAAETQAVSEALVGVRPDLARTTAPAVELKTRRQTVTSGTLEADGEPSTRRRRLAGSEQRMSLGASGSSERRRPAASQQPARRQGGEWRRQAFGFDR